MIPYSNQFQRVKHVVSKIVSTDSTSVDSTSIAIATVGSVSGIAIGENFNVSLRAWGGLCHASIESTVNPTTDSFRLSTEFFINFKLRIGLRLFGESTAVGIQAIIWEE